MKPTFLGRRLAAVIYLPFLVFSLIGFAATSSEALSFASAPAPDSTPAPTIRYREGKEVQLDELVVHGALGRPEASIVSGDGNELDNGLLRLRENFSDRIAADAAQELP